MPDRIFLVHGMGHHETDWHKPAEQFLRQFYDKYTKTSNRSFEERFKIVPVSYDEVFRDLLSTWQKTGQELLQLGQKFGADMVDNLVGWTQGAAGIEKNFFWTHAFDVVFYRMFPTVREAVKVKVANAIFKDLKDLASAESWSVIGHSLGTMVVHDTMHAWYTQPLGEAGKLGMHMRPRLIMMVANVSRILQTDPKVLDPGSRVRPGDGCEFYRCVYHPLDPFTLLRPFTPTVWPDRQRVESGDYQLLKVDHIQQANIHDLVHYLHHPDVVLNLFRTLRYSSFVTKANEEDYRSTFKRFGNLTDAQLVEIRQRLEDIGNIGSWDADREWEGLPLIWKRFKEFCN